MAEAEVARAHPLRPEQEGRHELLPARLPRRRRRRRGEGLTADLARPAPRRPGLLRAGEEAFFLSDDQARCVALTEELALKRGYTVKVVDIAKVGRFERLVTERLRGVQNVPRPDRARATSGSRASRRSRRSTSAR